MKIRRSVALGVLMTIAGSYATAEPTIIPDVVYGHKAGLAMTYHVAQPEQQNGAAILQIVSAGFVSGFVLPESMTERFARFLDAGFTVIAVNHGSSPWFSPIDAYADVSRAVRHVRLNSAQYGVDPDRLGVSGGSAGGNLALMIGLDADNGKADSDDPVERTSNRVAAVVAMAPPTDFRGIEWSLANVRLNPESENDQSQMVLDLSQMGRALSELAVVLDPKRIESISPVVFVTPDDPPTLLIHGDADDTVDIRNSIDIAREFSDKGVTHDMITIEGGPHVFQGEDAERARAASLAWFQEHLLD